MKLKYYIIYHVLGGRGTREMGCRTKKDVQHMINELKNYTMIRFETNCEGVDLSKIQVSN